MLLDVTGVLFDGSPLRPGVPSNARVPIRMQRGTSVTIRLKVINAAGQQVDLTQSGRSIVFAVKKKPTDNPPAIAKTVTGPAASGDPKNVCRIAIVPHDTAKPTVQAGRYGFDIVLVDTTLNPPSRELVIPLSPFVLEETDQNLTGV